MSSQNQTDDRHSDLAVMDAQEYKQKRRLQNILDARDDVKELGEKAYGQYAEGMITEDGRNIRILRAIQDYIRECYNLLMEYSAELEEGEQNTYWVGSQERGPLGYIRFHSRDPVVFWGLADVLQAQELYTEEWKETVETRHGPAKSEWLSETHTVPEKVSMNAFLLLNQFLAEEKSLEIQFEDLDDSLPTWGFEEVPGDGFEDTAEVAHGDD